MSRVEAFYDGNPQEEWERLDVRHQAEYVNSLRAILETLPPAPADLVDIGGGPGRYAIPLAQAGYRVTLVDLARGNLDFARQKATEAKVDLQAYVHGNALDLAVFPPESFAAALLMGPLYHLHQEGERLAALKEARRLLKPGGLIFAAVITRFAGFRDAAVHGYTFVTDDPAYSEQSLTSGIHNNGIGFTDAYFAHPDEVIPLCEQGGFTTLKMIGCEGILAGHEEYVNSLTGKDKQVWLDFNYRFAHEPTLYGASDHLLYIGRKEG